MSRRRTLTVAILLAVLSLGGPLGSVAVVADDTVSPRSVSSGGFVQNAAALHGNHVTVDPQITSNGTVVVESATTLSGGFVVIRTDDGGEPGDPIGHAPIGTTTFRTDVSIELNASTWDGWSGNRTLWAVIHADDGDGEFDPESDRSVAFRNPAASVSFTLGSGDGGAVRVLGRQFDPHRLTDGRLTVRHVDLADDGYVVALSRDDRVVGTRQLAAGSHANVSLQLDETFLDSQDARFRLRLAAYRDDGDGSFGDGDRPVRVGGAVVDTDLVVAAPTESTVAGTTEQLVVTPTPTATPAGTQSTATLPTPTLSVTPAQSATSTSAAEPATAARTTGAGSADSTASDSGLGISTGLLALLAIAAVALAAVAVARRRS